VKKSFIPVIIFALLAVLLWIGLSLDPKKIPSPLIDKALPEFQLPSLLQPDNIISNRDLEGQVYILNIWASWCAACRQEHPLLMDIARRKSATIIGLNWKDKRNDALKFLTDLGDPYAMSLADLSGRVGIDLGVYGTPETFLIDKKGIIRYKHIGPMNSKVWTETLLPLVEKYSRP
jgi:cytochrome c biogenesis protein CcmG, thiol:disulfide interchange protein DsbE